MSPAAGAPAARATALSLHSDPDDGEQSDALDPSQLLVLLPFPFLVCGVDELARWTRRRRHDSEPATTPAAAGSVALSA